MTFAPSYNRTVGARLGHPGDIPDPAWIMNGATQQDV